MYKLRHLVGLMSLAVLASVLFSVAGSPVVQAGGQNNSSFDMNDRNAVEKGASGQGISKVDDGELDYHLVAKGLKADHNYEVVVTIGSGDNFADVGVLTFPTTSDKNGKLKFDINGFDLGLDPGNYRLDFLVVHDHGDPNPLLRDLLLACQPAPRITIE